MTNLFGVHWIPTHRGPEDKERFARWQPGMVKIITVDTKVPYLEDVPPGAKIIIRNHPMSEDGNRGAGDVANDSGNLPPAASSDYGMTYRPPLFDALDSDPLPPVEGESPAQRGYRHAQLCREMADYCMAQGVDRKRLLFEGLNEPHLWAGESPEWTAEYYRAFLWGLHDYALSGVVGNFGVGWPGNGGVQDAPVAWGFWQPVINAMWPGDYLGLHEYWALNGPQQNWRWWAGRFLQCPYHVPILITECGIDTGVTGQWYGGWRDLPGGSEDDKARRYVDELIWYAQQCKVDGRVQQITPFTYDIGSNHWQKFNLRDQVFLAQFFARQADWPQVGPIKPPQSVVPIAEIRSRAWNQVGIPYNPDAAFSTYARAHNLGNPVTTEYDVPPNYRAQGFAGGIVYAPVDEWGKAQTLAW